MRSAQILAEMLLNEAEVRFGIVYGPHCPAEGYYVTGDSEADMYAKLAKAFNLQARDPHKREWAQPQVSLSGQPQVPLSLMANGFSFIQKNPGEDTIYFYDGGANFRLSPVAMRMMDLTDANADTPERVRHLTLQNPKVPTDSTAGAAFNIGPSARMHQQQPGQQPRQSYGPQQYGSTMSSERRAYYRDLGKKALAREQRQPKQP